MSVTSSALFPWQSGKCFISSICCRINHTVSEATLLDRTGDTLHRLGTQVFLARRVRGAHRTNPSSFLLVPLPFHYLPAMSFEKENKPQRKTQVLRRRPERSSTEMASTAALHYPTPSCQEMEQQDHHHHVWDSLQSSLQAGYWGALEQALAVGGKGGNHKNTCQDIKNTSHMQLLIMRNHKKFSI